MSGRAATVRAGRALVSEALPGLVVATLGLAGLVVLLAAARTLAGAAVAPGPGGSLQVLWGLLPVALATALPVGLLFGIVAAARSWREGGDWRALATAGVGTRAVVPAVLLLGLAGGGVQLGLSQLAEPAGRRTVRVALAEAVDALRLRPGQPAALGGALVVAEGVQGARLSQVALAHGDTVVAAAGGQLVGGGRVALTDGQAVRLGAEGDVAARLSFGEAVLRLDVAPPRVEVGELSRTALTERVARMRSAGRAPVAEALALHKRTSLPAALPLLALLAVPLGARGARPGLATTGVVAAWWVGLRLSDQAAGAVGPLVAAWLPTLLVAVAVGIAWASWRDR